MSKINTHKQAANAARQAASLYEEQILELQNELNTTSKLLNEMISEKEVTLNGLIAAAMSDFSCIAAAAKLFKAPHLLKKQKDLEKEADNAQKLLADFEANSHNKQIYAQIDPETGTLVLRLNEMRELIVGYQSERSKYLSSVIFKNYNKNRGEAGEIGFFDVIFFQKSRIERDNKSVLDLFGLPTLKDCYARYDKIDEELTKLNKEIKEDEKKKRELEKKWQEYSDAKKICEGRENFIFSGIGSELKDFLMNADYEIFLKDENGYDFRIYWGKLHALQKKIAYSEDIKEFLRKELLDRRTNKEKMNRVAFNWEKKPYQNMSADKSKWLIEQPKAKHAATLKTVGNIRSTRNVVYHYDDYDYYSDYYYHCAHAGRPFLAFDLFSFYADERPAYDGFNRMIFDEVRDYRTETGLDRPDFSDLKTFDIEHGNEIGEANVYTEPETFSEGDANVLEALIDNSETDFGSADAS